MSREDRATVPQGTGNSLMMQVTNFPQKRVEGVAQLVEYIHILNEFFIVVVLGSHLAVLRPYS